MLVCEGISNLALSEYVCQTFSAPPKELFSQKLPELDTETLTICIGKKACVPSAKVDFSLLLFTEKISERRLKCAYLALLSRVKREQIFHRGKNVVGIQQE